MSLPTPHRSPRQAEPVTPPHRTALGRTAEALACAFLERQGYQIEARNVRLLRAELDVIARQGATLCFIEVRSRARSPFGSAGETIGWAKRRHLIRGTQAYLQRRSVPWTGEIRFDVVTIDYDPAGRPAIQLIPGAFTVDR